MQEFQQKRLGIIFLNYLNKPYAQQAKKSIGDYELFEVDKVGISAAINEGLRHFEGYDAIGICANDIELPAGAMDFMFQAAFNVPNSGVVACYCVETLPPEKDVHGYKIHPVWGVFGNCVITKDVLETIGYFNEAQDPYGMQDSDYCYRANNAGFLNYYIGGYTANHLNNDTVSHSDYRKMKDEGLNKALKTFNEWKLFYDEGEWYLPYEQENYLINMQQWQNLNT